MPVTVLNRRRSARGLLLRYNAGDVIPGEVFARALAAVQIDSGGTRQTAASGAKRDSHYIGGFRTLLLEGARTNHFLNSATPATHTSASLGTGTYTLWMEGTGSIAVAQTTATITGAGTASSGTPVTFVVTGAGTVTYTVSGSPTLAQSENGAFASSYIVTTAAAVTRPGDQLSWPTLFPEVPLTAYVKYVDLGSQAQGTSGLIAVGHFTTQRSVVLYNGTTTALNTAFHNGAAQVNGGNLVASIASGDTVEARVILTPAGSCQASASRNGGVEANSTFSAGQTLGAGWGGSVILLGRYTDTAANFGFAAFRSVRIAQGVRSLSEMRAL